MAWSIIFTLQNNSKIGSITQIRRPHFWVYIYLLRMVYVQFTIYDKRDDFEFDIVNYPFLDSDFPSSTFYSVYISQLIHFARVSSNIDDFHTRKF